MAGLQSANLAESLQPITVHSAAKLGQVHLRERPQDERCDTAYRSAPRFVMARNALSDAASFANAFKRMRAASKESEAEMVAAELQEPADAGGTSFPPQVIESDSAAALQMQLQVIAAFTQQSLCLS